jgi:hypothetical protein
MMINIASLACRLPMDDGGPHPLSLWERGADPVVKFLKGAL